MFSPVGNHPPSVYWRRRIFVIGSAVVLVLLIVLTVNVVSGGDDAPVAASGSSTSSSAGSTPATSGSSTTPSRPTSSASSPASSPASSSASSSSTPRTTTSAAPTRCTTGALAVAAVVGSTSYKVGAEPVLSVQVTNTGSRPCIQDLADRQIVLKVYNGESRVWGSHDCEIQPGTAVRTLPVNQAVRVSITWSGRTSQEGCKGARQRVGAGSYTLYATLAGKSGKAARFSIS